MRVGPRSSRALLMAHGAGSTAAFVRRAFPSDRCAADLHCLDDRTGSTRQMAEQLCVQASELRDRYDSLYLGGVSIGA